MTEYELIRSRVPSIFCCFDLPLDVVRWFSCEIASPRPSILTRANQRRAPMCIAIAQGYLTWFDTDAIPIVPCGHASHPLSDIEQLRRRNGHLKTAQRGDTKLQSHNLSMACGKAVYGMRDAR